jgi:hypothetical protein
MILFVPSEVNVAPTRCPSNIPARISSKSWANTSATGMLTKEFAVPPARAHPLLPGMAIDINH